MLLSYILSAQKFQAFYTANRLFAVLLDRVLDDSKKFKIIYKDAENEDCIYYDLLSISDGLREVNVPVPLLKSPEIWNNLSDSIIVRQEHDSYIFSKIAAIPVGVGLYELDQLKKLVLSLDAEGVLFKKYFVLQSDKDFEKDRQQWRVFHNQCREWVEMNK